VLATVLSEIARCEVPACNSCGKRTAEIEMHGYAEDHSRIFLCSHCTLQLVRKLSEDLCALLTADGRGKYNDPKGRIFLCNDCSLKLVRKTTKYFCVVLWGGGLHVLNLTR
jgi:hypothetical protein